MDPRPRDPIAELFRLEPSAVASPFEAYRRMRERGPFYSPELGAWVVSRYNQVRHVLGEPELFSSRAPMGPTPAAAAQELRAILSDRDPDVAERVHKFLAERGQRLFMVDGVAHRRDRQRLRKAFTAARIAALSEPIRRICDELIDGFDTPVVDLVGSYANLVAARSLGMVLDVEQARRDDFVAWAASINAALAPIAEDDRLPIARTLDHYLTYFGGHIDDRRQHPGDDLLSAIVTARDDETNEQFSTPEVLGLLGQFVAAGVATTSSSIASTLRVLATRPDLARMVRDDPDALEPLVMEVLRLESPVQALFRVATGHTDTIAGAKVDIAPDDNVLVVFGAANRDPDIFRDPDEIDPSRANLSAHLAFGYGPHYCIGAPLGTTETTIAVRTLLDRVNTIDLADEPAAYVPMVILRGLAALPAHIDR